MAGNCPDSESGATDFKLLLQELSWSELQHVLTDSLTHSVSRVNLMLPPHKTSSFMSRSIKAAGHSGHTYATQVCQKIFI